MLSFSDKERVCEYNFYIHEPFWHLYTDGTKMANIFTGDERKNKAMLNLAIAGRIIPDVQIITFEIMSNHIHLILRGQESACLDLFKKFKQRIKRCGDFIMDSVDWSVFEAQLLRIDSLRSLRNEIIYVHRNAFVADSRYTPVNYPWGGGCVYFNSITGKLTGKSLLELGYDNARKRTHFRNINQIKELSFINDVVFIPSFCNIALGEVMFQDAGSYFHQLTRNAEAYSQIAARLKDTIFLTDDELYTVATQKAKSSYNTKNLIMLKPDQKIDLAKKLHFEYNATKKQLKRILRLEMGTLNELFPSAQYTQQSK